MKTKKAFINILFVASFLMLPIFSNAQNLSFREYPAKKSQEKKVGWQPVTMTKEGSNVKNGVEFYSQKGDCPYGIITLVKLVNTNNYAMKVSYKTSPESPVVYIMVPASATIEGSCATVEGNLSKLIIKMPEKEEDQKKTSEYLIANVAVSAY